MKNLLALPEGTELVGDYKIDRVIGAGGFGITYLASEASLARKVTIKEYFPADFAARVDEHTASPRSQECAPDYRWGLERFIEEAQTLARFDHPNIVRVYRYFRAHNTGYMVLHFEEGLSFKAWLQQLGRAPRQNELDEIVAPLLDALELIHNEDFLHRDIAPDNIIIRKNGDPVLIDFGSARGEIAAHSKTVSALVKPGYSPYEQYASTSSKQGPWTDIYSLAATLYTAIAGKRPPDAPSRIVEDEFIASHNASLSSYRPDFLAAIDAALLLNVEQRPRSIAQWRQSLLGGAGQPVSAPAAAVAPAVRTGRVAGVLAQARNAIRTTPRPAAVPAPAAPKPQPHPPAASAKLPASIPPSAPAKTQVLQRPTVALPATKPIAEQPQATPKPDTSAKHGRSSSLLDMIESWKRKAKAQAAASTPPQQKPQPVPSPVAPTPAAVAPAAPPTPMPQARPQVAAPPPPAQRQPQPKAKPRVARKATPKPVAKKAKPVRSRQTKPKRFNWKWRLAYRFAIGLCVASGAVLLQQRLVPQIETRGTSLLSSEPTELALAAELIGHIGNIAKITFLDEGRRLVSTGADATIRLWDTQTGSVIRTIELDDGPANDVAVLGNRAITAHKGGAAVLWGLDRGEKLRTYRRNGAALWSVAFAGSEDRFVTAGHDWALALWDTGINDKPLHVFKGHENAVQAVAFDKERNLTVSTGADKTVRVWDVRKRTLLDTRSNLSDFGTTIGIDTGRKRYAVGTLDGVVRLFTERRGRTSWKRFRGHSGRVNGIAFAPNGKHMASVAEDGTVRVWSTSRRRTIKKLDVASGPLSAVAFSPSGSHLAAAGTDGKIRIWRMKAILPTKNASSRKRKRSRS